MKNFYNKNGNKSHATIAGIILIVSTFILIFMINQFPKGGSRTVASFLAGMFGFTAIQVLRRSSEE